MKLYKSTAECEGIASGVQKGGRRQFSSQSGLPLALVIAAGLIGPAAINAQTVQTVASDGAMVLKGLTLPRGGVWLANSNTTSPGGHFWVPDGVLGFCRVDPAPGANPPFTTAACGTAAKTAAQAVVATPIGAAATGLPAGAKFVFVPDDSSRTNAVVRYVFNPATETLTGSTTIQVPNVTAVGGGTAGGRAQAAALAPNGVDLYVGYKASGDIMKIANATGTNSFSPASISKIGSSSDGRGVWSLVLFKNDLYLGELGGQGLSKIPDPAGVARAACSASSPCTAQPVSPQVSAFPGGLAQDGTYIYIGDAPRVGTNRILRWNPAPTPASATGTVDVYSLNVPTYTSSDGAPHSTYAGPIGLALAPSVSNPGLFDLYVGDDPSFIPPATGAPPTTQGHLWKVTPPVNNAPPPPSVTVTGLSPTSGTTAGGDVVTITGTGFSTSPGVTVVVNFGSNLGTNVSCASATSCTATSPSAAGAGTVDVQVTVAGAQSPISRPADQFTYNAPAPSPTGPTITAISPNGGLAAGGTSVSITGVNFTGATAISFGTTPAASFTCASDTSCTAVSPAGTGAVDIQVTANAGISAPVPVDKFTYVAATNVNLWAFGITAPKGGMVFIPGNQGGHFWSSDHANGFCRQDPITVAGVNLHAMNYAVCDDGSIGSPGQAVYDSRTATCPAGAAGPCHYIYVPDNAVRSVAVWRLTFDSATETIVGAPEGMVPLADLRTLKPNGMALGPDGNLYVTDLTEANIRVITNPNGDPRTQTVAIVAVTGDGRGANGTTGFIRNNFYISENRAATYLDVTSACVTAAAAGGPPCATTPLPLPAGVFIAGVATDPINNVVYASSSAGGSPATVFRYNVGPNTTPATTSAQAYVANNSASVPPNFTVTPPTSFPCAQTCTRPVDATATSPAMAFVFGLYVDQRDGTLYITEDATAGNRSGRGRAFSVPFVQ